MKLRLPHEAWKAFVSQLCARDDVESAGVILAEPLPNREVLVARELLCVPDSGYLIRRRDQLRIDPVALNRMIRPARERGLAIVTIHTHPGTIEPWFSLADDAGDERLMPSLYAQAPGPHGSMVIAGASGTVKGRIWTENGTEVPLAVSSVGSSLTLADHLEAAGADYACFERQQLALGAAGQGTLRKLHVGIVGLGGTGSVVLTQLAHLGIGRVTLVDGDMVEPSNVSRILGATRSDAGVASKVDVAARYVRQLGLGTEVHLRRGHLGQAVSTRDVEDCDVIFSCVDRHAPRAILNRLAYDRLVPVIDMGSAFRVDSGGRVVASAGRVVVIGPGRPCLGCWGHIDADRLRIEALPQADREALMAEGYVSGADVPEPSVVAFNTVIAGAAVVEFLRLVTSFAGAEDPPLRLSFDFESGVVRRNRLATSGECRICGVGLRSHVHRPAA